MSNRLAKACDFDFRAGLLFRLDLITDTCQGCEGIGTVAKVNPNLQCALPEPHIVDNGVG